MNQERNMFDPKTFSFDAEKMSEFFRNNDFTKAMAGMKMPGFDPETVMAAQRKNMDALVEANKAAAAGYQELFKKQMEIFEQTMSEAQKQMKSLDVTGMDADKAKAQAELGRAAFERAMANMQALAEAAQKANANAFEVVSARVKDSIAEMRDMGAKRG